VKQYVDYLFSHGTSMEFITCIPKNPKSRISGKSGIMYYNLMRSSKVSYGLMTIALARFFKVMKSRVIYKRVFDPLLLIYSLLGRVFRKKIIYGVAADSDCYLPLILKYNGIFFGLIFYLGLSLSNLIILQSNEQQRLIGPLLRKRSIVICKGTDKIIDIESFQPFSKRKYFLWVGRLSVEKRPWLLKELAKSGLLIKIAGRIDKGSENLPKELKEYANVEYLGVLTPSELKSLYQESFALLNTSIYEGFPETFIESWSVGTPVISLSFRLDDLLAEKGGVYARGSIQKMIEFMKQISADKNFFDGLSTSGGLLVKEKYRFTKEIRAMTHALQFGA